MTHQVKYRVHGVSPQDVTQSVTLANGEVVNAVVHGVIVEMVSEGHDGSSVILKFVGAAADEALKEYQRGVLVQGTFYPLKAE